MKQHFNGKTIMATAIFIIIIINLTIKLSILYKKFREIYSYLSKRNNFQLFTKEQKKYFQNFQHCGSSKSAGSNLPVLRLQIASGTSFGRFPFSQNNEHFSNLRRNPEHLATIFELLYQSYASLIGPHFSESAASNFRTFTQATRVDFGTFQIFLREFRQISSALSGGNVENLPSGHVTWHLLFLQLMSIPVRPSMAKCSVTGPQLVWWRLTPQLIGPNLVGFGPQRPLLAFLQITRLIWRRVFHFEPFLLKFSKMEIFRFSGKNVLFVNFRFSTFFVKTLKIFVKL